MLFRIREVVVYGHTWYIPEVRRYLIWRPCSAAHSWKRGQWWHGCPTKKQALKELTEFRVRSCCK